MSRAAIFSCVILGSLVANAGVVYPQTMMRAAEPGGTVRLIGNDSANLDSGETKKDIPCTVTPVKPILGFDLRLHSGYEIAIPLKELAGDGNLLTIIFRVTPARAKDSPVYFSQRFAVPDIDDDASGNAYLGGDFDVGEGDYHVDWMMRDRIERVCSSNWEITAALSGRDQSVKMTIDRDHIEASDQEFFKEEPAVTRVMPDNAPDNPLKVKILVNFAPQQGNASSMQPIDTSALVSILRNISREPKIRKFSLVDYKKLADPHSGTDFLTKLVMDELGNNNADAVVFAGPKVMLEDNVPAESL